MRFLLKSVLFVLLSFGLFVGVPGVSWGDHHEGKLTDREIGRQLIDVDIFDGRTSKKIDMNKVADRSDEIDTLVNRGTIIVVGEQDGIISEQFIEGSNLIVLTLALQLNDDVAVSTGFGDIAYTLQDETREYAAGRLSEDDFLSTVHWVPSLPLGLYELHFQVPALVGGQVWSLGLGKNLIDIIGYYGLEGLSEEETTLLPPSIIEGDAAYKKRFFEYTKRRVEPALLGDTVGDDDEDMGESLRLHLENHYTAQRAQDSTVAWNIQKAMQQDPEQVLVVLVEEISMGYRGGVLQALEAYGLNERHKIITVSQTLAYDNQSTVEVAQPHIEYGVRADYVTVREDAKRQKIETYRQRVLDAVQKAFDALLKLLPDWIDYLR